MDKIWAWKGGLCDYYLSYEQSLFFGEVRCRSWKKKIGEKTMMLARQTRTER